MPYIIRRGHMKPATRLKAKIASLQRRILWQREEGRCWVCGKAATEVMHVISRKYENTAFDIEKDGNCHLACRFCHDKTHRGQFDLDGWYDLKNGFGSILALRRRAYEPVDGIQTQRLKEKYDEMVEIAQKENVK